MSNKIFIILFFLSLGLTAFLLIFTRTQEIPTSMKMTIEGTTYKLLTASNPTEWRTGLMNRTSLDGADGMIFIFPDKQRRTFWNYNTYLNLDVYWMRGDSVVGKEKLHAIDSPKNIKIIQSPEPVDRVVEIVR